MRVFGLRQIDLSPYTVLIRMEAAAAAAFVTLKHTFATRVIVSCVDFVGYYATDQAEKSVALFNNWLDGPYDGSGICY